MVPGKVGYLADQWVVLRDTYSAELSADYWVEYLEYLKAEWWDYWRVVEMVVNWVAHLELPSAGSSVE